MKRDNKPPGELKRQYFSHIVSFAPDGTCCRRVPPMLTCMEQGFAVGSRGLKEQLVPKLLCSQQTASPRSALRITELVAGFAIYHKSS